MALMRKELLHKESSARKRVDRAQKEIQGMKTEVMMHVCDKAKLEEEVERWRYVGKGEGGKREERLLHLKFPYEPSQATG